MRVKVLILVVFLALLTSGCGSVISRGVLAGVDRDLTIELAQANPDAYIGRSVVWGGVIIDSVNLKKATEIEVLETPLYWDDRPVGPSGGVSGGRFIIRADKFLDTALFKEGELVTAAGVLKGVVTRKIGEMDYRYPVISPVEIKISEPRPEGVFYDYPPPWMYDPYWPRSYPTGYSPYSPYYPYTPYSPYYPYYYR